MNKNRIPVIMTSLAMLTVPAFALADKPTENPGKGPKTETPAKGNAYGKYCKGES